MTLENSVAVSRLADGWRRGRVVVESSTTGQRVGSVADTVTATARNSRFSDTARWFERVTTASWLYRWLTAEPEPGVVVIDLRETLFVGPILTLLEHLLAPIVRNWNRARVETVLTRLSDRVGARPVAVASTVVLTAILADLLVLAGLGTPTPSAVGTRLVVLSLALAGTRIRVSGDELMDAYAYELVVALLAPPEPPDSRRDGRRE